jgi:hypothetical protein
VRLGVSHYLLPSEEEEEGQIPACSGSQSNATYSIAIHVRIYWLAVDPTPEQRPQQARQSLVPLLKTSFRQKTSL